MEVLVAGSSGFIGQRLCPQLEKAGHTVRAMTRHPDTYAGAGEPVFGDVADTESLRRALAGCDAAYYLVHSLGADDFGDPLRGHRGVQQTRAELIQRQRLGISSAHTPGYPGGQRSIPPGAVSRRVPHRSTRLVPVRPRRRSPVFQLRHTGALPSAVCSDRSLIGGT